MPSTIEEAHREYKGRGLAVVAITRENPQQVAAWLKIHPVSFTIALDRSGRVTEQYGATSTPMVFVVGRDGKLVGKALGTRGWTSSDGRALFEALLGS